jgi:hypothetical protein
MLSEYLADAIRFDDGRPVAVGDQRLAEPTRAVRTGSGLWGLFVAGEDIVVVLHPGGAIMGAPGEVRERLEAMVARGGLGADDREAASSFLPFLGADDPGAAGGVPRSHVGEGVPPTWWLSGAKNSPPDVEVGEGGQPAQPREPERPSGPAAG